MNVGVQYAYCVSAFRECCRQVDGDGAFAYAAFAAYDGDFVFDFAHAGVELFNLLALLEESLLAGFHKV